MSVRRSLPLLFSFLAVACGGTTGGTGTLPEDSGKHLDGSGDDSALGDDASPGDDAATDETSPTTDSSPGGDGSTTPDGGDSSSTGGDGAIGGNAIKTVFVIVMENHSWSDIKGSSSAPFINALIAEPTEVAHAEQYYTPTGNHPSEPNYLWLEAGSNLEITSDDTVSSAHQTTTDHLVSQLEAAGLTWKSYQEVIDGTTCPMDNDGLYAPRHNPMVFFDDVTEGMKADSAHCIAHVRPLAELWTDLSAGTQPRYVFITPDLCDDMHGSLGVSTDCVSPFTDLVQSGDDWLKTNVPKIRSSNAYKNGGALLITWDEGTASFGGLGTSSDGPIGMIVVSPLAKSAYSNDIKYDHSSTLRTVETIFGVPHLHGALTATDLRDLFQTFP